MSLTPRWTPLRPHPVQRRLWTDPHRFKVVPAGRRSGKTELAKRKLVRESLRPSEHGQPARYFAAAPTREQAKRIYWDDLKSMVPPEFIVGKPSETELCITNILGNQIYVVGLDEPARIEGQPWDGGVLDEYGNMRPQVWGAHVRPALSDRMGWAWLIGVPEGRNHYYELRNRALTDTTGQWGVYAWYSADILPADEIENAKRDLDELTFRQEYEADFVNFEGRAYYAFDRELHSRGGLSYNPDAPMILALDFNVSPGVGVVIQESDIGTLALDEIYIPNNSNTQLVCETFRDRYTEHRGPIHLYGDATGGARGSAKLLGSDWDIAHQVLSQHYRPGQVSLRVPSCNPPERDRVNAMNSRLKPMSGSPRLWLNAESTTHLAKDLDGVIFLEGGSGQIDKKHDPALTHISDALGYYIHYNYGLDMARHQAGNTQVSQGRIG